MPEHDQRVEEVFELPADLLGQGPTDLAAVGARPQLGRDVVDDLSAGQARRQGLAAVTREGRLRRRECRGFRLGRDLGAAGFEQAKRKVGLDDYEGRS